ncbi:hypothetical protein VRZ08_05410 [Rhodopseudomonas sp. G2_2311]|uniref:hypothetical protein n=1 Tax=Rhodopseudomonas sp. G2_2311 TaxID=3114287 RepID=UPI0039C5F552
MSKATIYLRRNGAFGARCNLTPDTGHHITEDSGRFTVYSVDDPDKTICQGATREEAESAIQREWDCEQATHPR